MAIIKIKHNDSNNNNDLFFTTFYKPTSINRICLSPLLRADFKEKSGLRTFQHF